MMTDRSNLPTYVSGWPKYRDLATVFALVDTAAPRPQTISTCSISVTDFMNYAVPGQLRVVID